VVAVVAAVASMGLTACHHSRTSTARPAAPASPPAPGASASSASTTPAGVAGPCPDQLDPRRLPSGSEIEDILPPEGATTREQVEATVRQADAQIRGHYTDVTAVTVGDGWGMTVRFDASGQAVVVEAKDYMVDVHFASAADCRQASLTFYPNPAGSRVPIRFIADHG
jgi:hypothetical protein